MAPNGAGGGPCELVTWILLKNNPNVSMIGAKKIERAREMIFLHGCAMMCIALNNGVIHQIISADK